MHLVKKSLVVIILMVFLAVFVGIVYFRASRRSPAHPMVPTVTVSVVQQQETQDQVTAVGTLDTYQGINLVAQEDAVVNHIYFPSDDLVKAGDVVLEQDTDIQSAVVKQAHAELVLAEANYERGIGLYKEHYLSQQEFEQLEEKYLYTKAAYNQAEAELNKRIVTAPFEGQLGIFDVQAGDYASKGTTFVTLTNLNQLSLDFFIPEKYINQVKKGDDIQIKSAIDPNKIFTAKISVLDNVISDQTYMLRVQATVDNQEHFLKPGGFVNITIFYGVKKTVLIVPQTAIVYSNKGNYAYTVTNNTAHKTAVTLGEQLGQSIVVETGLKQGEHIVSSGTNKLHDGMQIKLSNQSQK
jgi:membrane fusion protein (multidrug efflux system)